jgi:hypothetical protein
MIGDTSLEDLKSRIIRFNNVANCANTAYHVKKYLERGFTIPPDQQQRFEELLRGHPMPSKKDPTPLTTERSFSERLSDLADDGYPTPRPVRTGLDRINEILSSMPDSLPTPLDGPTTITPITINTSMYNSSWGTTSTISNVITST